jgi:hypothetical protein
MENKLGCCGLKCEECPVFIAAAINDKELKAKIVKEWSLLYADYLEKPLEPKDINCEGCHSENTFVSCKKCPMRKCCGEKGYKTCASCNEYLSCGMLNGFFAFPHQQAKENLDALRVV